MRSQQSGRNLRPLICLAMTAAAQAIGFCIAVLLHAPLVTLLPNDSVLVIVASGIVHGAAALAISVILSLPLSWKVLNGTLPLLLILSPHLGSASGPLALVLLLLCMSLYLPTFWTRVPFFPTEYEMYRAVLDELPSHPIRFVDLGSGFGTLLFYLAKMRRDCSFVGFELSPLPLVWSKARALRYPNVTIRGADFWKIEWREFDVIYAFLSPEPMPALLEKVHSEGKRGVLLLINSFPLPTQPQKVVELEEGAQSLFIYRY